MIKFTQHFPLWAGYEVSRFIAGKKALLKLHSGKEIMRTQLVKNYTTIQKAKTAAVVSDESKTDFNSLISKVKLKQVTFSKNLQDEQPLAFDPTVALHVKSKKRYFLQKNVFKNSTFAPQLAPNSSKELNIQEGLFHGNGDDTKEFSKYVNERKHVKIDRESISRYELSLTGLFSNQEIITDDKFWKLLEDLLGKCLVPNRSLQKQLQDFCRRQFPKWDTDNMLKVCDWWVQLGKLEVAFLTNALEELARRDDLQAHHLVQIFYFIGDCKEVPYNVVSNFIPRLEKALTRFDHSELAIICDAFIKSRNRIESRPLGLRVMNDIQLLTSESDSFRLVTMLRFLSRSYRRDHTSLQEVAGVLTPLVPCVSFIAVPHVATAFAKLRCFHHGLYNTIADRTLLAVKHAEDSSRPFRLKDIWMLLWAFGRLNYYPPNGEEFFDGLIRQLMRYEKDNCRFPMQLVKSLIALSFLDIYPTDLINRIFDEPFLLACEEYSVPDVYKHLIILDNSIEIERPDYQGNRLPQRIRKKSLQVPHGSLSYTLELRNETRFVVDSISKVIGGRNHLRTSPILPHIRTPADVEISLEGESLLDVPVEEHRLMYPSDLKPDQPRYALLIQLENNYRFTPRKLMGVHVMKKRQLARLGYKVAEVPYYEWLPLLQQSEKRRMNYIRAKLRDADKAAEKTVNGSSGATL